MTYSQAIRRVNELVREIESHDDIDEVLQMYEEATAHLNDCEARLQRAQGRFETIRTTTQQPA